jgi:hypothetical protein
MSYVCVSVPIKCYHLQPKCRSTAPIHILVLRLCNGAVSAVDLINRQFELQTVFYYEHSWV